VSTFEIAGRAVGLGHAPFIVAELSGNHDGSLDRALRIVDAVAAAGASALKLQTYTAATMTLDLDSAEFRVTDPASPWTGETLYGLYQRAHTPWEWHAPIFERARARGLVAFSTPFDPTALQFLERLGVPAYKIASFEITDLELIRAVGATGKPLLLSTGMATLDEIGDAVATARGAGCRQLALLKCTSSYPADPADSNLATLPQLRALFDCEVGLSDHTLGIGAALAAIGLGATVIEKHVALDRRSGGVDAAFSLEPDELARLVAEAHTAAAAVGAICFGPTDAERASLVFRRSLFITRDMRAGERLTRDNLRAIRPGFGLAPRHIAELLGRRVATDVARGTPADWALLQDGELDT
jgi:pseudaminic acid synthase